MIIIHSLVYYNAQNMYLMGPSNLGSEMFNVLVNGSKLLTAGVLDGIDGAPAHMKILLAVNYDNYVRGYTDYSDVKGL